MDGTPSLLVSGTHDDCLPVSKRNGILHIMGKDTRRVADFRAEVAFSMLIGEGNSLEKALVPRPASSLAMRGVRFFLDRGARRAQCGTLQPTSNEEQGKSRAASLWGHSPDAALYTAI